MPSRKQRRRREKGRRHEYEYVYVDEEGHELDAAPDDEPAARPREKKRDSKRGRDSKQAGREAKPPSWSRSGKRALLFLPLFFIVFSLVNKHSALGPRILASFAYSVLFVPLTYMIDRTTYRSQLRRSGRDVDTKR